MVTDSLYSKHLENEFGENPKRSVSVYLPPNYYTSEKKYPVIYFLHGFLTDDKLMGRMKDLLDYAILEPSKSIFVLPATFDWNDLGTWGSLYDKLDKDASKNAVVNSKVIAEDAQGNMIRSQKGKIVVVDGLNDYIIVDKEEVLLIYPKKKEQDIKQVLNKVRSTFGDEYA